MLVRRVFSGTVSASLFAYAGYRLLPFFAPGLMPQPSWTGAAVPYIPVNHPVKNTSVIKHGDWTLTPLAEISQKGRVLGVERYRLDRMAGLCPYDIAMGWGPMSDPAVLKRITVWQDNRFYLARWSDPAIDWDKLYRCVKNIHSIPADDSVFSAVSALKPDMKIRLEGTLVNAIKADGTTLRSSTDYNDGGSGSCQVCFIKRIVTEA